MKILLHKKVKNLVFKHWFINILIIIVLYFIYRFAFIGTKHEENAFKDFLNIIDVLLNLVFSLIYLVGLVLSSITIFLNLKANIRHHNFLSFLTFCGIPIIFVIFLIINISIDFYKYEQSGLTTLFVFSVMYLLITALQFFNFRRTLKKFKLNV